MIGNFDNDNKIILGYGIVTIILVIVLLTTMFNGVIHDDTPIKKQIEKIGIDKYLYSQGFGVLSNEITTLKNKYVDKKTIYDYYIRHGYKLINVSNDTEIDIGLSYGYNVFNKGFGFYNTTKSYEKTYFEFQK